MTRRPLDEFRLRRAMLAAPLLLVGCGAAGPIVAAIAEGAKWLGGVVDFADGKAHTYFARHPSLEGEEKVAQAIMNVRGIIAAVKAGADAAAKRDALAAYLELRALLEELGILSATPPPGGPESDAAEPEAFELPDEAEVRAKLGIGP